MTTTNVQLEETACRNNIPLVGIFFKNNLPINVYQGCYIFNLADDTMGEGTHWVGAVVEGRRVAYFDPFGIIMPENVKYHFRDFLIEYSDKQLQNINSGVCGYYVIYFLYYMIHRRKQCPKLFQRMNKFLELWSDDPEENRTILEELIKPLK